jgi:DNA adenine methylase
LDVFDKASSRDGLGIVIKPFFKWPGSKAWLANRLNEALGNDFERIVEPFVGSAAFFLGGQCKKAILGDTNEHIAHCLTAVRDQPQEVIALLSQLSNTLEDYNKVKNFLPSNPVHAAARMIYLTNTSWGGLYRENRRGEFNVPFGNNGREFYCSERIMAASKKLRGAEIIHGNYDVTIKKSREEDLVFIDAPYVTKAADQHFDRYHASRFGWEDQIALAKMLSSDKILTRRILVTCAANSDLYELFEGWGVVEFSKRNSMTAYKSNTGNRKEALLVSPALHSLIEKLERKT